MASPCSAVFHCAGDHYTCCARTGYHRKHVGTCPIKREESYMWEWHDGDKNSGVLALVSLDLDGITYVD